MKHLAEIGRVAAEPFADDPGCWVVRGADEGAFSLPGSWGDLKGDSHFSLNITGRASVPTGADRAFAPARTRSARSRMPGL
jgi:hypothetical protein